MNSCTIIVLLTGETFLILLHLYFKYRFQARSQNCEKRPLALSCPSVCLSTWNSLDPNGLIFMKLDI